MSRFRRRLLLSISNFVNTLVNLVSGYSNTYTFDSLATRNGFTMITANNLVAGKVYHLIFTLTVVVEEKVGTGNIQINEWNVWHDPTLMRQYNPNIGSYVLTYDGYRYAYTTASSKSVLSADSTNIRGYLTVDEAKVYEMTETTVTSSTTAFSASTGNVNTGSSGGFQFGNATVKNGCYYHVKFNYRIMPLEINSDAITNVPMFVICGLQWRSYSNLFNYISGIEVGVAKTGSVNLILDSVKNVTENLFQVRCEWMRCSVEITNLLVTELSE